MKNITKFRTIALSLVMLIGLIPLTSFAQQRNDDFFRSDFSNYENRDDILIWSLTNGIINDDFGQTPLGSGLLILTAAGAGYAISRRRRNIKKSTTLLLAALMLLGMSSCKKQAVEPITPSTGNQVAITLNVSNGSKANVDPPHVNFVVNDKILVAHDGKYVGTLTYTEYETGKYRFQGNIDASVAVPAQKLYFYFLGNKQVDASLTAGTTTSCTVNISDQTAYPTLPVISFSASNEDFTGTGAYSAKLNNKCSLIKFNVTTDSNSPICITDMNNKVTVNFADRSSNDGFSYSKESGGVIKLKGGSGTNVEKWAIVLQQDALDAGGEGTAYTEDCEYIGARAAVPAITMDQYLNEDRAMTVNTPGWDGDLSKVTNESTEAFATARDGMTIYGELGVNKKISIADGATVTLSGVTINGTDSYSYSWAGLNCLGDATIILADGTINTVREFYRYYPGIHVPNGYTLTIKGTGTLNASSDRGAGIGGGWDNSCGNITIKGGTVISTGGGWSAGIGGGNRSSCGDITISGGTVTVTTGDNAAGIGSGGNYGGSGSPSCGSISITGGTVDATGGNYGAGIGTGALASCGNITISGGSITATGGYDAAAIGSGSSSSCGTITINNGIVIANGASGRAGIGTGAIASCNVITISGGTVTAIGGYGSAGIGCGVNHTSCVAINITGGSVTATGGSRAAGIGSGYDHSSCGAISISGGTVEATGGEYAAGIGIGTYECSGGSITIETTVTRVTATKGSGATNSIGGDGYDGTFGTVTIGGTVYWDETTPGSGTYEYKNGGNTYLATSPLNYVP